MTLTRLRLLAGGVALCVYPQLAAAQSAKQGEAHDFQVYRARIEPIFLKAREGGKKCYDCHSVLNTALRLQQLSPGSTTWSEEQSRQNFEVVLKLITPGDPMKSRLLLHPLAPDAGGDPTHSGGKFWTSRDDAEWQMAANWVRDASATRGPATSAAKPTLDFEFFKTRVEPIFMKKRIGHARCFVCHTAGAEAKRTGFRFEDIAPGNSFWTEEQSRRNYEHVLAYVQPGDPLSSRLLIHPLAPQEGGDDYHTGGRQFANKNDPDWLTIAEWIRGAKSPSSPDKR